MMHRFTLGIVPFILTMVASCQPLTEVVNLYTDRHYDVDQELYDAFEAETGIKVNVVKLEADPLLTRLETEGNASQADLIFLADAGRLGRAKAKGLLQPFPDEPAFDVVPDYLIDDDRQWIALTKRARIFVYDPLRTPSSSLSTYEDLANPLWYEKLAIRSSSHVYNQSLVASMLAQNGQEATSTWLTGFVNNFAIRDPLSGSKNPVGNDRDQAKAVANGIADVAVMNSYYFGRMLNSEDPSEVAVAESLAVFFPNQDSNGTHINISGMGLTQASRRQANATRLVSYLLSASAQRVFADSNYEYPANQEVVPHPLLQSWGNFKEQTLPLSNLATYSLEAYQLMIEAGWR
ncbi:MAG: Fe(3+) ABC transporter substrate-binding protein [Bacilli bacterium]